MGGVAAIHHRSGTPLLLSTAIIIVAASSASGKQEGKKEACAAGDRSCEEEGHQASSTPNAARESEGQEAAAREREQNSGVPSIPRVTLPLSWSNIGSLSLLLVLAIIGGIAVWHVATRRTCRCGICTGKYTVKTNMGSGGFGSVFTCTSRDHDDNKDDCFVLKMIKIDHISEANEAQAEAKELRSLRHPLIVRYQDDFIHTAWGKVGEMIHVCIVMERCSFDLRELIEDRQEHEDQIADYMEEDAVLRYFAQICSALSYCHHKRIMHRDIKVRALHSCVSSWRR